jgi:hypothetical protein
MGILTYFTGVLGLEGCIIQDGRWNKVEAEIRQLVYPLPGIENDREKISIKLYNPSVTHFADILVSVTLEDDRAYDEIEKWLLRIEKRTEKKDWFISHSCFFAYRYPGTPAIYYYDGYDPDNQTPQWRKIEKLNGVLLQEKTGNAERV